MQSLYANSQVPKGNYICLNCGSEQIIEEKNILMPCSECGYDEFKGTIIMELSYDELNTKLAECIRLLAINSYLFEKHNIKECLNVISINLRMLLCDGENSLLPLTVENPMFHKGVFNYESNVIFPEDMFASDEIISLADFLSQIVIRREGDRPVTVSKMIRAVANKCGGAHIDTEIAEDFYLASSVSKYYFVNIAKYIINLAGFDYDNIVEEFLSVIR